MGVAAAAALLLVPTITAKQYLSEDFAYPPGNLYNQGGWLKYGKNTEAPIQVVAEQLSYPGYQDAADGKAVKLSGNNNGKDQRLWKEFSTDGLTAGACYASMLLNVSEANGKNYLFSFVKTGYSGFADEKIGTDYGRLFVEKGSTDGKYKVSIAKNTASGTYFDTELNLGETYLVVVKYDFTAADGETVSLWINPATDAEPAQADASFSNSTSAGKLNCVTLYQGSSSVKIASTMTVDALRVADTWADLFEGNGGGSEVPGGAPAFTVSTSSVDIFTYAGLQMKSPVVVKAENLTDDITVTLPATGELGASTLTIPKDEAMSANGYTLEVWPVTTTACENMPLEMTLSTEGCDPATIKVNLTVYPTTEVKNAGITYKGLKPDDYMTTYRYTGKGVITFIDNKQGVAYGQDSQGGFAIKATMIDGAFPFKVGDVVSNLFFYLTESFGSKYMDLAFPGCDVISENNPIEPEEVTLADLSADWDWFINRLFIIKNVEFKEAGKTFSTGATEITSGDATGKVRAFGDTDAIGAEIPAGNVSVTGIVTSKSGIISIRSAADVVAAPSIELTTEQLFDGEAAPINSDTRVGSVTVKYQNLTKPAMVYIGGANRAMFKIDVEEIPAGTGEAVINVTYHPTAIGKHTGRLQIDATPTELSQGKNFTFAAYDPENMPSISVDDSQLTPFVAAVGETMVQSVTVKTANMIDYGNAAVMKDGNGAFTINSATLLKSGETLIKITFAPKSEGTFTERIMFSGMMTEPVYITVTGSTNAGPAPEIKEGDEMVLSTENPLKYMVEGFDGVTSNKPLKLNGWVNNATVGNRAWWGYTWTDEDNSAAKVTAYDSKMAYDADEPCQMTLVTPALDYVNADSRFLTFRLMGDNLRVDQEDQLEVLYIEPVEGAAPYIEPLKGMNIPVESSQNKEWLDYIVDLDGQNLADVFFIGFRFTGLRGHNSSTIYYIDDVTWGRTDVPVIKVTSHETQGSLGLANIEITQETPHVEHITVAANNLTEDIAMTLKGQHADFFTLSTETLPSTGGAFDVTFQSPETGEHAAYIEMTSKGAAPFNMMLIANVSEKSGITMVPADADGLFRVYNMTGVNVLTTANPADIEKLAPGLYIINGVKYMKK